MIFPRRLGYSLESQQQILSSLFILLPPTTIMPNGSFFRHSDCTAFKLASITSLYLAVKVHNQKPFSAKSLASLTRGEFSVEDITQMETMLLKALDWQLCPPIAASFCGYFNVLLQPHIKSSVRRTILQRSCFFSELGVMDFSLTMSGVNQSEIALAAILNSMSGVSSDLFSNVDKNEFVKAIEQCSGMDSQSLSIKMARKALWVLYHRSTQYSIYDSCKIAREMRSQCTSESDKDSKNKALMKKMKQSEGIAVPGHIPVEVSGLKNGVLDSDVDGNINFPGKASKKMSHCHDSNE